MGFRPKNRVYRLVWEPDHDLHGFEVTARGLRLGELLNLGAMAESAKDSAEEMTELVKRFADVLVDWNREDAAGAPVPANADGLMQLEDWEFFGLLDAYISAGTNVSADLGKGSLNGGLSPAAPPPMDDL